MSMRVWREIKIIICKIHCASNEVRGTTGPTKVGLNPTLKGGLPGNFAGCESAIQPAQRRTVANTPGFVTAPSGYESDMPAFRTILPDSDIAAALAYIKS